MKYDDLSFKFLALVIIAGVVLALTGPSHASNPIASVPVANTTAALSE